MAGRWNRSMLMLACIAALLSGGVLPAMGCTNGEPELTENGRYLVNAVIKGERFRLETALTEAERRRGLGGREEVPKNGGMVFAFPASQKRVQTFYMADCLVDIDIAYVDDSGRVVKTYTMPAEPLRRPDEDEWDYIQRLPLYSSVVPVRYVVELRAGTLDRLGVKEGDRIEMDWEWLKEHAR